MDAHQEEEPEPYTAKELSSSEECSSRCDQKKDPLLIKLKVPNNLPTEVKDPGIRTCEYCGKEFMNGKALGGHIRIHTQEGKFKSSGGGSSSSSRKLKRKIDELEELRDDLIGNDGEGMVYSCCICDKKFRTNKSLCGHMRFHPERSWRGVQPPTMNEEDKEAEEEEEDVVVGGDIRLFPEVDLLKDLENWSRTEKRGRCSLADIEPEAAHGLMKLACAISDDLSSSKSAGLMTKKEEDDEDEILRSSEKDKEMKLGKNFKIPRAENPTSKKKVVNRIRFECTTCHKIFPSFQALGGHRSIHNKERGMAMHPSKISPYPDKKKIAIKEEQDSRCHCQALDRGLLAESTSPVDELSTSGPRIVLPIDLNEIPTIDDDDEALESRSKS